MGSLEAPPKLTRAKRRTPRGHGGEECGGLARIERKKKNRPKRTYLTLTRPTTQYRSTPMDETCTGGIRAPNQEGQWETEVLKMGAGTREVPSAGCDSGRGVREGWTRGRLKLRVSTGKKTKQWCSYTGVTSRRAGLMLRRAREFIGQRCDVETTSRRDRETINPTSRR